MSSLFQLFIFILSTTLTHSISYDHECGDDPSNLWLDVVVLVDNSKNITDANLYLIASNIVELFGQKTRIGTTYSDPRSTRVGLVTYNQEATIVADLNKFQSFDDLYATTYFTLFDVADTDQSFLAKGLQAAEQVLRSGRSNNYRNNYKQMIIVYTALYQGTGNLNPMPVATRLKNSGINIAVVDMISYIDDMALNMNLQNIASEDMFYNYGTHTYNYLFGVMCQVNCFCRDSWTRFLAFGDHPTGVCLQVSNGTTNWSVAKLACQNSVKKGYLVTDFNSDKHGFLQDLIQSSTGSMSGYHIGLNFVNGAWYWQQAVGQPLNSLTSSNQQNDILWNSGYPRSASSNTGVATISDSDGTGWENINPYNNNQYYICEVNTCDTDNYCA